MLAFATIYGEKVLNEACKELLDRGIIGTANLELLLKSISSPQDKNPDPLIFQKERLNRHVPTVDLRRYDHLLFESETPQGDSSKQGENSESGIRAIVNRRPTPSGQSLNF